VPQDDVLRVVDRLDAYIDGEVGSVSVYRAVDSNVVRHGEPASIVGVDLVSHADGLAATLVVADDLALF
jgi:hypothetical protein